MKNTFVKTLASILVVVTLLSTLSLCGFAFDSIDAEQESVSAMMDNAYCFKKPENNEVGTETDTDEFGTETDVDFGTWTDADEAVPETDAEEEELGFFARIFRCIRNFFSFKWLF